MILSIFDEIDERAANGSRQAAAATLALAINITPNKFLIQINSFPGKQKLCRRPDKLAGFVTLCFKSTTAIFCLNPMFV